MTRYQAISQYAFRLGSSFSRLTRSPPGARSLRDLPRVGVRGLPGNSDLRLHQVRQAPDLKPVFAALEVHCIDLFLPLVLDISEAHGSQILRQHLRVEECVPRLPGERHPA